MSKTARKLKHNQKMARKRAVKGARKNLYASLAGTGKKRKRKDRETTLAGNGKHAHLVADCGNPGCKKCNPPKSREGVTLYLGLFPIRK